MGATRFDGVDDHILLGTLAGVLQNVGTGAYTFGMVARRAGGLTNWQTFINARSGATNRFTAGLNTTNDGYIDHAATLRSFASSNVDSTTPTYLVMQSKTAGSTTPEMSVQVDSGGTMAHSNADGTVGNVSASDRIDIGCWGDVGPSEFFNGWVGVVAFWDVALSQVDKAACGANWQTSDFYLNAGGTPIMLIQGDVTGSSWIDLIGNVGTVTATGTTLDAGETLDAWNFDGFGSEVSGAITAPDYLRFPKMKLAQGVG